MRSATRNLALLARGLAKTSSSAGLKTPLVIIFSRALCPQRQSGRAGGHRQSLASSLKYRLTILSSKLW